jgi:hypothetical protein
MKTQLQKLLEMKTQLQKTGQYFSLAKACFSRTNEVFMFLIGVLLLFGYNSNAQTVVSTINSFSNNNGIGTVTFNLQNTNNFDILIKDIDGVTNNSGTLLNAKFYYKTTPIAGSPGAIDTSAGWNLVASGTFVGTASTTTPANTQRFLSGINLIVPANTTYGIAVYADGQRFSSHPGGTTIDSAGGVYVITGTGVSYGGGVPPNIPPFTPRGWIGSLTYTPLIACTGTPYAGNAVASSKIVCSSSPFLLSLANDSLRLGIYYQWQKSSTGLPGSFVDILNDTSRSLMKTQTTTSWYRCITSCGGSLPDTSAVVRVITPPSPLSGNYTVNSLMPTSATNFQNIKDFVTTVSCVGIAGPVILDVDSNTGPYEGNISFGSITGSSQVNTISINGHGNVISSKVSPIINFNGTEYLTIDGFKIIGDTGFSGIGVHFEGQSRNITINNNLIDVGITSILQSCAGITASGSVTNATASGNNAQNLTITNNEIVGGYYSMTLVGRYPYLNNTSHLIQNNIFRDFYYYGLYVYYADTMQIVNNDFHQLNRSSNLIADFRAIYQSTCRNVKIISNKFHDGTANAATHYITYLETSANSVGYETEYINNSYYNIRSIGPIYAMYFTGLRNNVNIFHNTIALDLINNTSPVYGIYSNGMPTSYNIKNNIISLTGFGLGVYPKYCFYSSASTSTMSSNNNVFHIDTTITNAFVGYWGGANKGMYAWKTSTFQDSNSVNIDPVFANTTSGDLEPQSYSLNNFGTPVGVLIDSRGVSRSITNPDVGSVEFTIPLCTAPPIAGNALSDNSSVCKGQSFTLSLDASATFGIGQTYQWEMADDSIGPYTNLPAYTKVTATIKQLKTHWYRVALTCNALTSYSAPVMVHTDSIGVPTSLTIDTALAVSGTNFHSLTDILQAMNCKGVTSPVTITYAPYNKTFTENVNFGNISGASSTNRITIYGNGNTITSNISPIMTFSNTAYVTIDSLNIDGTSSDVYGIHFSNSSKHITIRNSKIDVGITSISMLNNAIVASSSQTNVRASGNNLQYLTLENNEIVGGFYAIAINGDIGPTTNYGHIIKNNLIRDFYSYGIYLDRADTIVIDNNDINRATRPAITTFYGNYIIRSKFIKVKRNSIHASGTGSYGAYPILLSNHEDDSLYESEIINNRIFDIRNTGVFYGIYALSSNFTNVKIYHNTVQYEVPAPSISYIRGFLSTASNNVNVDFRNNIISISGGGSGNKTGIYVSNPSSSFITNNNTVYVNTGGTNDDFGYWGLVTSTLLDWQTATSQATNSRDNDPIFTDIASGNLVPTSGNIDNIGAPLGVLTDIGGGVRSLTTPDPGAYEFTGAGADLTILSGELIRSSNCYSYNDTIVVTIKNLIGSTIDFGVTPIGIDWNVSGPINTSGVFFLTSGVLAPGGEIKAYDYNVNRSIEGTYTLNANLQLGSLNLLATNDTFTKGGFIVRPILSVSPKTVTVSNSIDSVQLKANSTLFQGSEAFFSEICHMKQVVGMPISGWPAYLIADDYIELTGLPNFDMEGHTLEEWSTTAKTYSVTFPVGTIFGPNGTMVLATGRLNSSLPNPASFYYHTGNTISHIANTAYGYLLKDENGTIIDAVGYGNFSFPSASGVTSNDWSGITPALFSSGNTLNSPDNNTSSCWVNSSMVVQTPNILNSSITGPVAVPLTGLFWTSLGSSFSTAQKVTVGPYSVPGTYAYIATYSNVCGTFYDTAFVTASSTVPVTLTTFRAKKIDADINLEWKTASEVNNDYFQIEKSMNGKDFNAIGRVEGMGSTNSSQSYTFVDENAAKTSTRALYYRLRQADNDGTLTYSKVVVVDLSQERNNSLSTYPNPSDGTFTITVDLQSTSVVNLKVLDMLGSVVWAQVIDPNLGANEFNAQLLLPDGVYMLLLQQDGETSRRKLVIEH